MLSQIVKPNPCNIYSVNEYAPTACIVLHEPEHCSCKAGLSSPRSPQDAHFLSCIHLLIPQNVTKPSYSLCKFDPICSSIHSSIYPSKNNDDSDVTTNVNYGIALLSSWSKSICNPIEKMMRITESMKTIPSLLQGEEPGFPDG
jgi:hypothetical protein